MHSPSSQAYPLVTHFARLLELSEDERKALGALAVRIVGLKADQDIVREGDKPSRSAMLIDGLASTTRVTTSGKRQITTFHIAGSWPDLESLHLETMDCDIATISECVVAFIDHDHLRALCNEHPRLAALLWRTTLVQGSIYREWVTNIGQRDAFTRIAHLLCEMMVRMEDAGLAKNKECSLPISQLQLGEATGMSTVHVNRTLQAMREAELIELKHGRLKVLDWNKLVEAGEFDPTYLHRKEPASLARH